MRTKKVARSVTGERIKFEGEVITNVTLKGKTLKLKMFVLRNTNNLFGTDWIQKFELWDSPISDFCQKVESFRTEAEKLKKDLRESFPKVFSEKLGCCTKMEAKFKLKENVTPVFKKKRSVPFASIQKIDEELDRLVKTGILTPIDYSEWAAPTVYVKKKSKDIRVCADFSTGLNAALKDHHYPLPSPEEVFTKLNGGRIFSKIDLSEAYLQIPVEEESSKLLCITTHKGLFKFNRLAFGIKVAPAIFQQIIDTLLSGLDFSIGYLDDILMKSESIEQHRKHVFQVFERIKEYGFTLKDTKCEFFLDKIKYLGQIIDRNGRRPDPERSIAIKNMPEPHNITTLQSFLGLANYYQSFIPNMHTLRAPLNELL
ncbi:reverse transcriptase family protein, partial [Soonwooa purpurea]